MNLSRVTSLARALKTKMNRTLELLSKGAKVDPKLLDATSSGAD